LISDLHDLFDAKLRERLLSLRHDLHRHPELSFEEEATAARLESELEELGAADVRRVAGTGVVARIPGTDPSAPTVAVRGDIDALPIQEDTGLPYQSENPGIMHACGHDVHATWAVGGAALLKGRPADGDVIVLLQPAEETGKGAPAVLESGALDGVAAIFGAHVDRRFEVGRVVAQAGPLAAASDNFAIEILGRGAHGARPHEARDPIVGLGALVGALQTIVARRLEPGTPAVVSVGVIQAGTAPNIIPETARLEGTIRSFDPDVRRTLHDEVRRLAGRTADAHGLEARVDLELGPPSIVNAAADVEWARTAATTLLGPDALVTLPAPNLAGEDFAFYLERMRGCFLRIGAREPDGDVIPAHTRRFYAADGAIFVGGAVLAETARAASAALARQG
jgi:hippurate hydrolase